MKEMHAERKRLMVSDRARIKIRLRDGSSRGSITKEIIRDKSLVSRKVSCNGGRDGHFAQAAESSAIKCHAISKRPNRMLSGCELFDDATSFIRKHWPPSKFLQGQHEWKTMKSFSLGLRCLMRLFIWPSTPCQGAL